MQPFNPLAKQAALNSKDSSSLSTKQSLSKVFLWKKSCGSALISALFIMTLVAIAATAMSFRLQLDIYRTQTLLTNDKLYLAGESVLFWAMDYLTKEEPKKAKKTQSLMATLPNYLKNTYANIKTNGELYDLQTKLNINNLQDPRFYPIFIRLLNNLDLKTTSMQAKLIIKPIAFWLRPFKLENNDDKFLSIYLKQRPPYYPAYQPIQSLSELTLIAGIDKKMYNKLLPYIMAVPEVVPINIYKAPKILLKTLGNGLSDPEVESLLKERNQKTPNLNKIHQLLEKLDIPPLQITFESNYFLSVATVTSEEFSLKFYTIIKKNRDKNGHTSTSVIKQSINMS